MVVDNITKNVPNDELFPEGLASWSGHRDGGVRKPFKADSGRPVRVQIETPLVKRLGDWVKSLVCGEPVPRVLLLVGGPGNGKTDAVEGCIDFFDKELGACGALVGAFAEKYDVSNGLPPRKVVINLASLGINIPEHLHTSISLVQDATEGDLSHSGSPEELLLKELEASLDSDDESIYLCCVNRGILASTAEISTKSDGLSGVNELLTVITNGVTSSPKSPSCWPLEGYPKIALWPMDVESLVDKQLTDDGRSVAHQIFDVALDASNWKEPCDLKTRCPFCQNRKMLTTGTALDSLIEILHYYELASGKRWTFRDLFSLISYLLVGDSSELMIGGKSYSPCDWSAKQFDISKNGLKGSLERDRAPYLLMSRLYHHRLFPRWPSFNKGEHFKAKVAFSKSLEEGLDAERALFRFTVVSKKLTSNSSGDVPVRVRNLLGPILDPALSTGDQPLFTRMGMPSTTVDDLENSFSLSISDGMKLVESQLETLERDVLKELCRADEALVEDRFSRSRMKQARLLQSTLRQFSARVAKRSLGTKSGVCRNVSVFRHYLSATSKAKVLSDVRRGLHQLLHDDKNQFRAGLATTFGQPVAHRSKDVTLLLRSSIKLKTVPTNDSKGRPIDYLPYLKIEDHYVALTFELFRALCEVNEGLHEASLSGEIYSLLDLVKSLVSGRVVRDEEKLSEEPVIRIGSSNDEIEWVSGQFVFRKGALN